MLTLKRLFRLEFLLPLTLILTGMLLRWWKLEQTAFFDADQENFAFTAVRIIEEKRPVLIGIKAGEFPVFIGPLMYYVYAFFLWLFSMDPRGMVYFSFLVAVLTLASIFFLTRFLFGRMTAMLALLLYAFSMTFIDYDRRVWLPGLMILTSLWIFYTLFRVNNRSVKWWLILGLLLSFGFQLHMTALFYWPIVTLALFMRRVKWKWRYCLVSALSSFIGFLPIAFFDLRHDFLNLKGWITLFQRTRESPTLFQFGHRLLDLIRFNLENEVRIFSFPINYSVILVAALFLIIWIFLAFKNKKESLKMRVALLWLIVPIIIFWPLQVHVPEYYLILNFPMLVIISAHLLVQATRASKIALVSVLMFVLLFVGYNFHLVSSQKFGGMYLPEKKQAVDWIIAKAEDRQFTVYYDASTGLNYGFDYLFYWRLGWVPQKAEKADYAIVIPWIRNETKLHQRFGNIGVIESPE